MTHERAFELVAKHCPGEAGRLWNTTNRTGCDTAHAVADQYGEHEISEAVRDLELLAGGEIPRDWEPA